MENQHRKITGYRELDQTEIDLMNEVKALGPQIEDLIRRIGDQYNLTAAPENDYWSDAEPGRWLAIARTNIQQGLMAMTRAVAKPDFF